MVHVPRSKSKSLAELYPQIAGEAEGWDANEVLPGSNKKLNWRCSNGHVWEAIVINRVKKNTGCPYCSGRNPIVGVSDLATTHPLIAAEADGWDPTQVGPGSGKKLTWKCQLGHIWAAVVETRTKKMYGCPYCSGRKPIVGVSDLATTHPLIAAEADGWDPATVMAGTNQRMPWKCSLGHQWETAPNNRLSGTGCPVCINKKLLGGYNDLITTHPLIAAEADGWDPATVMAGSPTIRSWKCSLGHEWRTSASSRTSQNLGCPFCGNQRVLSGFNDLATSHPHLASEADGWDPSQVIAGSNRRLRWKCEEGHRWVAMASDRKSGTGCPTCARFGFDPNKDGYLYLLENVQLMMLQIGITNVPDKRLQKHARGGWVPIDVRGPMDGHLTRQLETQILRSLKRRNATFANKIDVIEFDGWSEAWLVDSYQVSSMSHLLELVYSDDVTLPS